jgi:hypothetical protein
VAPARATPDAVRNERRFIDVSSHAAKYPWSRALVFGRSPVVLYLRASGVVLGGIIEAVGIAAN